MNKQINTAVTGRGPVFCSTLTPRPWEADDQSCRGRLNERSLHLCLGAILKVCVISGGDFNQCEIAATPEMDFPNGKRGLVHVSRPPTVLHSCGADKAFCCILTSEERLVVLLALPASSYNRCFQHFSFCSVCQDSRAVFSESGFIQQLSRLRSDLVQFEGRTPSERAAEGIGEARQWRGRAKLCV